MDEKWFSKTRIFINLVPSKTDFKMKKDNFNKVIFTTYFI